MGACHPIRGVVLGRLANYSRAVGANRLVVARALQFNRDVTMKSFATNSFRVLLVGLAAATALPAMAATNLIGSSLTFSRVYPTTTTPYLDSWVNNANVAVSPATTVVAVGSLDSLNWSPTASVIFATLDPEALSITFSLPQASIYGGNSSTFDGFRISGISFDMASVTSSASLPAGVLIGTSFSNTVVRTIDVNLNGNYLAGTRFTVNITPVPEPGTYAMLLAGLAAVGFVAKRRKA